MYIGSQFSDDSATFFAVDCENGDEQNDGILDTYGGSGLYYNYNCGATLPPTAMPTEMPTALPTALPTPRPTALPTASPMPTALPSLGPTPEPTLLPSLAPTAAPTLEPTSSPTLEPTPLPTPVPTEMLVIESLSKSSYECSVDTVTIQWDMDALDPTLNCGTLAVELVESANTENTVYQISSTTGLQHGINTIKWIPEAAATTYCPERGEESSDTRSSSRAAIQLVEALKVPGTPLPSA